MASIAIVIALGSFLASVVCAVSAYRSSRNSAAQVHEARTPDWRPTFEPEGDVLCLRLLSNHPLETVTATIVDGTGVSFSTSQGGVDPGAASPVLQATWGPIEPADKAAWRLALKKGHARLLHLRVRGTSSTGESWDRHVEVELPAEPWAVWR
ncbi:hypothetical protein [Nocardia anaemiae]|uniref:hypothetical protein n=1 Tax=Nocardia anaemiae TaxID=263910 RepID=UPI0007A45F60|nr:hypothetical protein [Nocardia anaemiae]